MSHLVTITDKQALTTSLIIASVFEKHHKNVLQAIESVECSSGFAGLNFQPGSYLDANNQLRPMYNITRDGFMFLGMAFTGPRAARFKEEFIAAFNRMEQMLLEGSGDYKRVDVNMKHTRGVTNHKGLDIVYRVDLTKIMTRPTRPALEILQRITGIDMDDILPELSDVSGPNCNEAFEHFIIGDYIQHDPAAGPQRFKNIYAFFKAWALQEGFSDNSILSKRRFSSLLQLQGYKTYISGGSCYVGNIKIVRQEQSGN